MQQYPVGRSSQSTQAQEIQRGQRTRRMQQTQRTQPALPGAALPTTPPGVPPERVANNAPRPWRKSSQPRYSLQAAWKLALIGLLLGVLYVALYPLFAGLVAGSAGQQALLSLFPWLPRLYWTNAFPALSQALSHFPLLNAASGNANLLLVLLLLALLLVLLAWQVGRSVLRKRLSRSETGLLFWLALIFVALFGLTFLLAPPVQAQTLFLYGMYGRMVAIYHVNPYVITPSAFPHDLLYVMLSGGTRTSVAIPGPVWIDMSIPITLFAHGGAGGILLAFRVLGLVAHVVNTMLIWAILAKLKPETRLAATLLYGWNPLVLLFSVASMQLEVGIVLFLLLGILFFLRKSLLLGWVFLLLAALVNALCLLLLPLFFRFLRRETRLLPRGQRFFWWVGCVAISILVVVLAYAPFWSGWGWNGLVAMLKQAFWPTSAINSLDAALINLPVRPVPALSWLFVPHHWILFAAIAVGLTLLLGVWLIDSLELALLFSSWIFLALFVFFPASWPWLLLAPLALCAVSGRALFLTVFLLFGALFSFYYDLEQSIWQGQALLTIGLPVLLWGWLLFFTSTWHMTRASEEQAEASAVAAGRKAVQVKGFSRPGWQAWSSRPSWPGRRRQS
ncbi:MAG TPA: hypothetical protein VKV40_06120 [Ktedonobacteraceae bacterium]|nr:hypothetical protein [Ktedonobacteraceae bacterium]